MVTTATHTEPGWEKDTRGGTTCMNQCAEVQLFRKEEILKNLTKYVNKVPDKQV